MAKLILLFIVTFVIYFSCEAKYIVGNDVGNEPVFVAVTSLCYEGYNDFVPMRYKCEVFDETHKFYVVPLEDCSGIPNDEDYIDATESYSGYFCKELNKKALIIHYTNGEDCNSVIKSFLFSNPESCNRVKPRKYSIDDEEEEEEVKYQIAKVIDGKVLIDIYTDEECKEFEGVTYTYELNNCKNSVLYDNEFIRYQSIGFDQDEEEEDDDDDNSSGSNGINTNGFIVVIISLISMVFLN